MKKILISVGILFLIAAAFSKWILAPQKLYRIPKNWVFHTNYLGDSTYADETGKLPETTQIGTHDRKMEVLEWTPKRALIHETYTAHDVNTGDMTYEIDFKFEVDPKTGKHITHPIHPEAQGLYYLFPQNTQRMAYVIFNYNLVPLTFQFKKEEKIGNLNTYVFEYQGVVDVTESYAGSPNFPGIIPPEGQRILSEQMVTTYWIDPVTGECVKMQEWSTGDYFQDIKTGENKGYLSRWGGEMTNNSVNHRLREVADRRLEFLFHRTFMPFGLLIIGSAFLLAGVLLK